MNEPNALARGDEIGAARDRIELASLAAFLRAHYPRVSGVRDPRPRPSRRDYASFARFSDPEGNGWVLQEVTQGR